MYWNGHESSPASTTARLVRWVKTVTKSCMGYPAALQRAATRSSCLGTTMFLYPKFCKEVLKNYVNIVKFLQKKYKAESSENIADSYNLPFPWKWFCHKCTHMHWDAFIYTPSGKSGTSGEIIFTAHYKTRSTPHRMERQMAKMKHDKEI